MDRNVKDSARLNSSSFSSRSDGFESVSSNNAKHQASLVEWLNGVLPDLRVPANASDEELRDILIDGSVLCRILNKLKPGSVPEHDSKSQVERVGRFLSAMDEMGLPRFQVADLEKGSMKMVLDCLSTLRTQFMLRFSRMDSTSSGWKSVGERMASANSTPKEERFRMLSSPPFGEDRRRLLPDSKSPHGLRSSPKMTAGVMSHAGHKFHEVFQLKQGSYTDLPAAKISEMMKSNSLDNAPTQSLLSVVNGILDESVEMKSGAIPYRVACLLRKVVQEIERRICTQAEHLRTQNNLFKAREEKYQSRIRVLEALATGTSEETQIVMNQLKQIKNDKNKIEEKKKAEEHETWKLVKEKDDLNQVVANLRQELREINGTTRLSNENDDLNQEVANLRKELSERSEFNQGSGNMRQEPKERDTNTRQETKDIQQELQERLKEALFMLTESRARIKELEAMEDRDGCNRQELKDRSTEAPSLPTESKSGVQEHEAIKTGSGVGQHELEDKLKEAHSLLTESRTRIKELEAMNAEIGGGQRELQNRLKEAQNLLKESRDRVKELEERKAEPGGGSEEELKDRLKEAQSLLRESRARIKELEASKIEAGGGQREIEDRSKEAVTLLADSRARVKELEAMKAEADNKQQELVDRLDEALNSVTQLKSRVQELEAMKVAVGGTQQELENRLKEAVSSLNESKARVKDLEAMTIEGGGTQQDLEKKLKEAVSMSIELRSRVKELEAMDAEARSTKQELEDRLKEAVSSLNESRSRVKELEAMKAEAHSTQQELENRLKEAESSLAESRSQVKELEAMKAQGEAAQQDVENRLKEAQSSLKESRARVKELEALSKSKSEWWKKKEQLYQIFTEFQLGALRELRFSSQSIQQEIGKTEKSYSEEFSNLGAKIKVLGDAAKNYHPLLAENRKLHNELQELKGNIRVYCRIRPFLPGQKGKQSIIEYIGENGELTVANPTKPGKEGRRSFRFDKVYGPTSTQAQVFADTQPLIQSVLDGFNVCIFAYGQTGSGKTYTMTGPDGASEDEWGVNYRALKNLFTITQDRGSILQYEVSVQMVEIYNEQVRDLLSNDGQKKLGILTSSQPNGLAVPDASIQPVNSTGDVMKLMDIGLQNRAKSSTAMNERSSRSHSIVSIHTRGTDLKSGSSLRGSLHLVDLAGSERVDRSEVTGDRLKEAQHINKSLSALGDVIFALSQKSAHVPYRNSKLTQVLQSSLGGHAKTLMFVQLNPDATSFSETLSTLKFAERVSGVELGAAKSNKDNKDVRELMDQVATLKESLAKKDEEIVALQQPPIKDPKSGASLEKKGSRSLR
ncbi:kinesin-like protein KIN-14K [Salvia miltiorrhiza]|uniref:kinesin-like protein KIN-14K n=1 Tax=Salvia miltiorrhiza TaxID=226208 RepID=UPI0025AD49E1|nr:kinesin-like protein KIN-14K [Salvia miltiorrhiza]